MSTMTKKRVAELEGAQLDWAVAKSDGKQAKVALGACLVEADELEIVAYGKCHLVYEPSAICAFGGPIIERERISTYASFDYKEDGNDVFLHWVGVAEGKKHRVGMIGKTQLIAAMRAFVASKLGDEVEVPE